jgi:hypothetical protein
VDTNRIFAFAPWNEWVFMIHDANAPDNDCIAAVCAKPMLDGSEQIMRRVIFAESHERPFAKSAKFWHGVTPLPDQTTRTTSPHRRTHPRR